MVSYYILKYFSVVVFIFAKGLFDEFRVKAFLFCHLHEHSHLFLTDVIVFFAFEPVEIFLRINLFFALVDKFLHIDALSKQVLIVVGGSIVIYDLLIKYSFGVFLFDFIEFFGVFFLLEEEIIVDAFELVWIEVGITF